MTQPDADTRTDRVQKGPGGISVRMACSQFQVNSLKVGETEPDLITRMPLLCRIRHLAGCLTEAVLPGRIAGPVPPTR